MLEKKQFTGGLDTDSEARLLAPNDYRYALNIRSGSAEDADIGAITNVKGNTLITFDLPAGTNKCVGTYEDKKNKRILYHVHNSNKDHQILEYNYSTDTISLILKSAFLNYDPDFLIWHNNLINDNLFYWVDNFGDPHKLNIGRAREPLNAKQVVNGIKSAGINEPGKVSITFTGEAPYSVGTKIILSGFSIESYNTEVEILSIKFPAPHTGANEYKVILPFIADDLGSGRLASTKGYPTPFKKQYLDAIVYPPLCAPTVKYEDDISVKTNNLRGSLFQFKTQFVYADAEKSAWSPISKLPMPEDEEKFASMTHMPETKNNRIDIRLSTGDELVTKINVAARTSNTAEGDFFLIDTLDKDKLSITSNSFHNYKWYNDGTYSTIDVKESNKLYDRVPQKAACQEFINGNRLAYMNILEDYDAVNVDMKITPLYREKFNPLDTEQPTITNLSNALPGFNTWQLTYFDPQPGNLYTLAFSYRAFLRIPTIVDLPRNIDNYTLLDQRAAIKAYPNLKEFFVSGLFSYSYIAKQGDTKTNIVNSFINQINQDNTLLQAYQHGLHFPNSIDKVFRPLITPKVIRAVQAVIEGTGAIRLKFPNIVIWYHEDIVDSTFEFFGENINSNTVKSFTTVPIQRAFKRGARHEFAITYYDFANRSGHANKAEPIYVKFFTETTEKGHVDMDVEINHTPPIWATHYQLLYTKNQTTEVFIQGLIDGVRVETVGNSIDVFKISIDHILNDYKEDNPNSILGFVPKAGDRIHFIKDENEVYYSTPQDWEILGFDSGTAEITIPKSVNNINPGQLAEIYSPGKTIQEKFYYEIGECWEIGDAGLTTRYHKGNQNQTSSLPAIIHLVNEGDIYYKQRFIKNPSHSLEGHLIEEFNFSDFYLSAHGNEGRANVFDPNIKQIRRPNTAYFSEIFIPDSFINGLSSIFGDSFKEYDQNYGSAQRIYTEDKRLICFNELKVGMILVSESVVFDQTGQSTIHKSQEVLSDIIYYAGEYGIGLHPGSFAVYGNRKYFADVNRGAALRLSQDGITPISEYKMHNHFTDAFKEITTGQLLGVYDIKFGEYVLSYPSRTKDSKITGTAGTFFTDIFTTLTITNIDTSSFTNNQVIEICYFDRLTRKEKCVKTMLGIISDTSIRVLFGRTDGLLEGDEVTIKTVIAQETIAFNERLNRWVTFYSYLPEMMSGAGIDIVTFTGGKLYKHNDNVTYNNFYGGQYSSIIEFIANENPSAVKFFLGIEEESNGKWKMPRGSNLNGQVTSLIDDDFEDIEGVFWAALFKDENSNGGLLEGEDMRGHGLFVRLQNDKTVFQKLFSVGVRSELSQRTNV